MSLMLDIAWHRVFKSAFFSDWLVKALIFDKGLLNYLSFCVIRDFTGFTFIQCLITFIRQKRWLRYDLSLILVCRCCAMAFKMDCFVVCVLTVYLRVLNTPTKHVDSMSKLSTLFLCIHWRWFLHLIKLLINCITMRVLFIFSNV